jgi:hypothetical protein
MDSSMRDEVLGITLGCLEVFVFVLIGMKIWEAVKTA